MPSVIFPKFGCYLNYLFLMATFLLPQVAYARHMCIEDNKVIWRDKECASYSPQPSVDTPSTDVSNEVIRYGTSKTKFEPTAIFQQRSPSIIKLYALNDKEIAQGSAIAVKSNLLMTNCHVVEGGNLFGAQIGSATMVFELVRQDKKADICVLKVQGSDLPVQLRPVTEMRAFSDLKVGERVFAIGSPSGLENTFSEGMISGLRVSEGVNYIQTTTPITHGSSGGGLFDEYGNLLGVTTGGKKEGNINFSVSIEGIDPVPVPTNHLSARPDKKNDDKQTQKTTLLPPIEATRSHAAPSLNVVERKALRAEVGDQQIRNNSDAAVDSRLLDSPVANRWLTAMSMKLKSRIADKEYREDILKTVYYEATRTGLHPGMVLALIDVLSGFRKYAVSSTGARGFMQVMPFWVDAIGTEEHNLFHMRTNLRYGCTILRHYLNIEKGDLFLALGRYNGSVGDVEFQKNVLAKWKTVYGT